MSKANPGTNKADEGCTIGANYTWVPDRHTTIVALVEKNELSCVPLLDVRTNWQ